MNRLALAALTLAFAAAGCSSTQPAPPAPEAPPAGQAVPNRSEAPPPPPPAAPRPEAPALSTPLQTDPAVRVGTLENGLTYYVRANTEPENRAELRLAINAGSILEEDDQQGLAHMLEHMAFNGTESFPEQALVQYLEGIGMQFGADVNAYTSFDETVYMLQVPTDSMEAFTTGLDVLSEWAGRVTIDAAEVEKERGVVLEEWRLRQGAQGRVQRQQFPVLFQGSRYAERLPIGKTEVLETAPAQRLRDFYEDWYRPDLMAVIVVGDVDVNEVEAMIRERFGALSSPADAPERPTFGVPMHEETLYTIATDPELPQAQVAIQFKNPPSTTETVADVREGLVRSLFSGMLNERLSELARGGDAPFALAFAGIGGGVRSVDFAQMLAIIPESGSVPALVGLLTEAERVRRHGFTSGEFTRRRAEVLRSYERALAEKDNTPSGRFAMSLVSQFLEGDVDPGIEREAELARALVPGITLDEVNAVAEALLQTSNRVVSVTLPEKEGITPPTEAELTAALAEVARADIAPYEDATTEGPLVSDLPPAGSVVSEEELEHGVTRWTLSNGIQMLLKPTDFKAEQVLVTAFSPGGTSLLDLDTYRQTRFAAALVSEGGVGDFDAVALGKKLAGQVVSVRPFISEREEGFEIGASPDDLETTFQLVHLYATAPREDPAALATLRSQLGAFLGNRAASPEAAFGDTLSVTLAQNHPRRQPLALSTLDELDLAASLAVYRERFADMDDFTFVVVGNFDPDTLRPLAETYLASLPSLDRVDRPVDVGVRPPGGVVKKTVRRGVEPKAQVDITFHGELDAYSFETESGLQALGEVLQTRLREELREERGGVYFVRVGPQSWRQPRPEYRFSISFGTDPERVDELIGAVMEAVEEIKTDGPEARYVENVREGARRADETNRRQNFWWMRAITESARYGTDLDDVLADAARMQSTTPESVRETARRYLDTGRYVQVVLLPEASE